MSVHAVLGPEALYRAVHRSRLASHILAPLLSFDCHSDRYLYATAMKLPWEAFMTVDSTFVIDAHVSGSHVSHSRYAAQKLKDALCDRFREQTGKRPSVDKDDPDVRINLVILQNRAVISLDAAMRRPDAIAAYVGIGQVINMQRNEAEGWRFVAFTRLVPLFPFNLLNYALGLTRIPLLHYVVTSFVFMLPGTVAYTYLGFAGREAVAGSTGTIRNGHAFHARRPAAPAKGRAFRRPHRRLGGLDASGQLQRPASRHLGALHGRMAHRHPGCSNGSRSAVRRRVPMAPMQWSWST